MTEPASAVASRGSAPWVLVGYSVRALAASARRAGLPVITIDACADADTRRLAQQSVRLAPPWSPEAVRTALARLPATAGVVFTGGAEASLSELSGEWPLAGNTPQAVTALGDPTQADAHLRACNLPVPPRLDADAAPDGRWLHKPAGGGGGVGIRRLARGESTGGTPLQRELPGRTVGVLFVADGNRSRLVGAHRQWHAPGGGFRYGGAVTLPGLPPWLRAPLHQGLDRLTRRLGLRGLNGVDLRVRGGDWWILEVNPRPCLTVDIHDSATARPLFLTHLDAVEGTLPEETLPLERGAAAPWRCHGHAIVYTPAGMHRAPHDEWPPYAADRPVPGSPVTPGTPLCTLHAFGPSPRAVAQTLRERIKQWRQHP